MKFLGAVLTGLVTASATIHKPVRVVPIENDAPATVRLERDGRAWAWVEATG